MKRSWFAGWMVGLLAGAAILGPGGSRAAEMPGSYVLPGDKVFPEGIAYEAGTDSFYVGSTTDGTIFRGNATSGAVSVFSAGGSDGRTAATGMKTDGRGHLIVAGAATGWIFVYDTGSGALVNKFDTGSEPKTFLNDVTITPDGAAYVTDSVSPYLYKLTPAGNGFTYDKWLDFTGTAYAYVNGFNSNGIVSSDDGRYLLIIQSATGKLFRVATADKSVSAVSLGTTDLMAGDGMLLNGHRLHVMRNALQMFVWLDFNDDYSAGTLMGTSTDPSFAYPTTFARAGNRFLVVNSQFNKRGAGLTPVLPFTVSNVAVPGEAVGEPVSVMPPGMPSTGAPTPLPWAGLLALAAGLLLAGRRLRVRA
jgi:Cu-Zn family superoxide dismutase